MRCLNSRCFCMASTQFIKNLLPAPLIVVVTLAHSIGPTSFIATIRPISSVRRAWWTSEPCISARDLSDPAPVRRSRPSKRSTFDKVHTTSIQSTKLRRMFAFIYIFLIELASCIDIKLKFYTTLYFYSLAWFCHVVFFIPWILVLRQPLFVLY